MISIIKLQYLFGSPSTMPWQIASNMGTNSNNQMKINDSQLFFLSLEPASPFHLQMYKVTYGNTAVDWAQKITWKTSSWKGDWGETLMSSDSSKMYTIFLFGDTSTMYTHFVSLNSSNGNTIGTRYISNGGWAFIDGATLISNSLIITMRCPTDSEMIVVDLNSNSFTYRKFSTGDFILGLVKDPNYSR